MTLKRACLLAAAAALLPLVLIDLPAQMRVRPVDLEEGNVALEIGRAHV